MRKQRKPSDYIRKGWCQGANARTISGISTSAYSRDAQYWCALGAILRVYGDPYDAPPDIWSQLAFWLTGKAPAANLTVAQTNRLLVKWNDAPERTQQEVIDLLEAVGL